MEPFADRRANGGRRMEWARILAYITGTGQPPLGGPLQLHDSARANRTPERDRGVRTGVIVDKKREDRGILSFEALRPGEVYVSGAPLRSGIRSAVATMSST